MENYSKKNFSEFNDIIKKKKVNAVHPSLPGAVGSHESLFREERDYADDTRNIIDDVIMNIRSMSPRKSGE